MRLAHLTRATTIAATTACLTWASAAPVAEAVAVPTAGHATAKAAPCVTSASEARVKTGAQGVDPNTVTAAEQAAMEAKLQRKVNQLQGSGQLSPLREPNITISTYVHVITRSDGTGGVTKGQVKKQIKVLNDAYAGLSTPGGVDTHFRFALAGLDYTASDDWYAWDDQDEHEAKTALHVGNLKDLNVYVTSFGDSNLLGYATFPQTVPRKRDGVVILNDSLPGGAAAPYNEGDTLTHEVGHWLNLYHTFQGGCSYPGDEVSDTPYQDDGANIFSCDESLDTCPDAGLDPVHNFMSYGDDPCLDRFTAGQSDRMLLSWQALRSK